MLFFGVFQARQFYLDQKYLASLKWVLLEVIAPPDVEKSPKVAEFIFSALHAVYLPVNQKTRFFKGKVVDWYSFEVVGTGGEPHFYIRTLEGHRNLVETQIFAQYPEAEIRLVEKDYVDDLPVFLPNDEYNLFGSELVLSEPNAYPIRTYEFFEEQGSAKEAQFKRTDPLASIFENLSTLEGGQHLWLQFLIRPTGKDWIDESKKEIDKVIGKEAPPPESRVSNLVSTLDQLIPGGAPAEEKKKEEKKEPSIANLTPGKRDLLTAIEKKISKLAYETGIRFVYIAKNESFNRAHISGIFGLFRQFTSPNGFKPNKTLTADRGFLPQIFPSDKGFFANAREFQKKWKLHRNYRKRLVPKDASVLNVEELATLWHLPGLGVKAPLFPRVDSKKSQPPPNLPIG